MQTVYVDVLVFINLVCDYLVLLFTKKILHISVKGYRLILGSIFCALLSPLCLFFEDSFIYGIALGAATAALGVFVTFGRCCIGKYIKRLCCFFCVNFLYSGFMICIYLLYKPQGMVIINNVVYFQISPVLLIILTLVCYFILTLFDRLIASRKVCERILSVSVVINSFNYSFKAIYDTGCSLTEPFSGCPVIAAEKELFANLNLNDDCMRVVPFSSIGGEGIIYAVKAEKVYINGAEIKRGIYIGFCQNAIKGEVKALVPKNLGVDI